MNIFIQLVFMFIFNRVTLYNLYEFVEEIKNNKSISKKF